MEPLCETCKDKRSDHDWAGKCLCEDCECENFELPPEPEDEDEQ